MKQVDVAKKSENARKIWYVVYWTLALACGIGGVLVPLFAIRTQGYVAYGIIIFIFSLFYFYSCHFFINQAKKTMEKNDGRAKAFDRRYLKQITEIVESFVRDGAQSAHQTLLSLLGNDKANAVLVLPWLVDAALDKATLSTEDQASLEEFVAISRIDPSEIPYPQKERIVKSLILSKIPGDQKERMSRTSFLSGIPFEKGHIEPAKKIGCAGVLLGLGCWIACFVFLIHATQVFFYVIGFSMTDYGILVYFLIPLLFCLIIEGIRFGKRGNEMLNRNRRIAIENAYSERAILTNKSFVENGPENAYREILSLVENDKTRASARSIRALPLIADTLLGKDTLTPEDRASFIRFMEISGVDSSQIPDELKERIVQSFLLSKIPYEQKEGLLRPIILRAKSNADARIRVDDGS
jgi:hypothetical protein